MSTEKKVMFFMFAYFMHIRNKTDLLGALWHPTMTGMQQGSVLGPRLFSFYITPLVDIFHHFYADDIQLHFSIRRHQLDKLAIIVQYLSHISDLLAGSFLT